MSIIFWLAWGLGILFLFALLAAFVVDLAKDRRAYRDKQRQVETHQERVRRQLEFDNRRW